ncbi:unnamed protein product [Closterium sp. NIES-64]|nr:unnamed protein product [Closterium sp. NIES-64]
MASCLPRSALVAAILLAAVVAGSRCISGQRNNPLVLCGEVMGVLASEWGNDNLASVTCQEDSLDILLCNNQGQVVAMAKWSPCKCFYATPATPTFEAPQKSSEWGNDNLASVTCQEDSLDILTFNGHGQVVAM